MIHLPAGRVVAIAFLSTLAILVGVLIAFHGNTSALIESGKQVDRTHAVLGLLERVRTLATDLETAQRGFVLTGRDEFLEPWRHASEELPAAIRDLRASIVDTFEQAQELAVLEDLLARRTANAEECLELYRSQGQEAALELIRSGVGREIMDQVRGQVARMAASERALLDGGRRLVLERAERSLGLSVASSMLGIVLACLVATHIRRDLARRTRAGERWRQVIEASPVAVVMLDAADDIVLVNRKTEETFGFERGELIGKPIRLLLAPGSVDNGASPRDLLEVSSRSHEDAPLLRCATKDGPEVPVEVGFNRVVLPDGEHALVALVDISDFIQMEESLRAGEERLTRIVETIAEGVFISDARGRITFANAAAERLLGLSRAVMTQRSYDDPGWEMTTLDGKPFPPDELPIARAMRSGSPVHEVELCVGRPNARPVAIRANSAPLLDAEGAVSGVVTSVSDITRRKEVERLKDALVATVSHELRTPLASLRGFAELMLKKDFSPEKRREFLTIIHDESVRLTTLINDFLDIQRIEAGVQSYELERIDLAQMVRKSEELFDSGAGDHRLRVEIEDGLPRVQADPARMRQVLANLISNACKFSPQGSEVFVRVKERDGALVVSVSDQGIGIAAEDVPKLFTKFFRANNEETRAAGGTGLGLALVKEIVEAHGGRVWVETAPGGGSTFFFSLPHSGRSASHPTGVELPADGQPWILLVEDDASFARLLSEHLSGGDAAVRVTGRAEEALDLMKASKPALVVLDIRLAGELDGWDVLTRMKADPALRAVPVLVVSESDQINARGLAMAGVEYVLKPASPSLLLGIVEQRLGSVQGKSVVVVDDDPAFRLNIREWIAGAGAVVEEASGGQEALRTLQARRPDLLILDLLMPDLDGFEVLRQLRLDKRAVNLPVLVVTGKELTPTDKEFLNRGMASLVRKHGSSLEEITAAVQALLAQRSSAVGRAA